MNIYTLGYYPVKGNIECYKNIVREILDELRGSNCENFTKSILSIEKVYSMFYLEWRLLDYNILVKDKPEVWLSLGSGGIIVKDNDTYLEFKFMDDTLKEKFKSILNYVHNHYDDLISNVHTNLPMGVNIKGKCGLDVVEYNGTRVNVCEIFNRIIDDVKYILRERTDDDLSLLQTLLPGITTEDLYRVYRGDQMKHIIQVVDMVNDNIVEIHTDGTIKCYLKVGYMYDVCITRIDEPDLINKLNELNDTIDDFYGVIYKINSE